MFSVYFDLINNLQVFICISWYWYHISIQRVISENISSLVWLLLA